MSLGKSDYRKALASFLLATPCPPTPSACSDGSRLPYLSSALWGYPRVKELKEASGHQPVRNGGLPTATRVSLETDPSQAILEMDAAALANTLIAAL